MTWGKIDDKLHSHAKVLRVSPKHLERLAGIGLWTLCLSFGCDYLTDGRIERAVVVRQAGSEAVAEKLAACLVAAGFWIVCDGGWIFHDWERYQPLRAEVEAKRQARAEAGRAGGVASGEARAKQPTTKNEANASQKVREPFASASHTDEANANSRSRSRPDPVPTKKQSGEAAQGAAPPTQRRGTRLPENWQPPSSTVDRFRSEGWDAMASFERFTNHWHGKTGKDATKLDWSRTFTNWILEDIARGRAVPWRPPSPQRTGEEVVDRSAPAPERTPEEQREIDQMLRNADAAMSTMVTS